MSNTLESSRKDQAPRCEVIRGDKKVRENLTDKKIDDMVDDSFPASDPPSTY